MKQSHLAIILIIGILAGAWYFGYLPGAEVVDGKDANLLLSWGGYDAGQGALFESYQTRGVYSAWQYGTDCAAFFTRSGVYGVHGWTEELCNKFGAEWESDVNRCNFGAYDWRFTKYGSNINNFKVTRSELKLFCGSVYFNDIVAEDIEVVPHGLWFPGITIKQEDMTSAQLQQAKANSPCNILGDIWIIYEEECVPEWQCTGWSPCLESNLQTRTCTDVNECGTLEGKPAESQFCTYIPDECCGDGICQQDEDCATCPEDCGVCVDEEVEPPAPVNPFEFIIQSIQNFFIQLFGLFGG